MEWDGNSGLLMHRDENQSQYEKKQEGSDVKAQIRW